MLVFLFTHVHSSLYLLRIHFLIFNLVYLFDSEFSSIVTHYSNIFNCLHPVSCRNVEALSDMKTKSKDCSRRIQDLRFRLLPESDISVLSLDLVGDSVRDFLYLLCFGCEGNVGIKVLESLAEIYENKMNLKMQNIENTINENKRERDNNDDNQIDDDVNFDALDFEVENTHNLILLTLQNISNSVPQYSTIFSLLNSCNIIDIITNLRVRLFETRLLSVEKSILGTPFIICHLYIYGLPVNIND